MIYDCFTFFNELDLLEIRLNILDGVVDKFVLVEATKTFSNLSKPLYYKENKERFKKFENKIVHIIVDDFPPYDNAWTYEHHQRNAIARGLTECKDTDVILISDLDEIPNPKQIEKHKNKGGVSVFVEQMFYYYINNICITDPYWVRLSTKMLSFAELKRYRLDIQKVRFLPGRLIQNGGWHFSYLGGAEKIVEKIRSFSHQEYNSHEYTDSERIERKIENGENIFDGTQQYRAIPIDDSFPIFLQKHKQIYMHLTLSPNILFSEKLVLTFQKISVFSVIWIKTIIKRILRKHS